MAATVVGTWVTALAALRRCPYRVRWVMSRAVLRDYWSFSWPLFVGGLNGLIITQLAILGGNVAAGLAGVAAITLASTVWRYAQRVDEAITQTMFPVVAKVIDRPELMRESFLTSNRLALLCSAPSAWASCSTAPTSCASSSARSGGVPLCCCSSRGWRRS